MPDDPQYTLQDLADLGVVSPRTIRYYVAQGLLPSPDRVGPGALYGPGHLARLRLIRRLQREHLPLAEVRARLGSLDDQAIIELEAGPSQPPAGSASEYVRSILASQDVARARAVAEPAMLRAMPAPALDSPGLASPDAFAVPASPASLPPAADAPIAQSPAADRSQWDRVVLVPDVELHVRRPLTRHLNKQVERLIAIARQLLEEDLS